MPVKTNFFWLILQREFCLGFRTRAECLQPVIFFSVVVLLFPLAFGSDLLLLQMLAPAIIWISSLLAVMFSSDSIFRADDEDGTLEQWLLLPVPLPLVVLAKVVAHACMMGLPLILLTPLFMVFLNLDFNALPYLIVSQGLGFGVLCLFGAFGAALLLGSKKASVLLVLLLFPFYLPVLVFGISAVKSAVGGFSALPELSILAALFIFAVSTMPFAIAGALRLR